MEMGDAAEALHDIFDAIHACFVEGEGHAHSGVGAGEVPKPKTAKGGGSGGKGKEGEEKDDDDDEERGGGFWAPSVVSDGFGIHVIETIQCTNGACNFQYPPHRCTRFFQLVLFDVWRKAAEESSGYEEPETLLRRTYNHDIRACQKCSKEEEVMFEVRHSIAVERGPPVCFTILVGWMGAQATSDEIEQLCEILPLSLDLSKVMHGVQNGTMYRLRSMMCLYGQHFIAIAFNPSVKQWVQYDDGKVTPLGGWHDVVDKLKRGRHQPEVCFYERA